VSWVALAVGAVAASVTGHLWADMAGKPTACALLKATASAAFLVVATLSSAGRTYGHLVLAGLAFSAVGDLFLLAKARGAFLGGIAAFLLAHVVYAAAFAPAARVSVVVAVLLAIAGAAVVRWLWPHLGTLRGPVVVYATAITVMLVLALGVTNPLVRLGAALFYVSDLSVARDRFVRPGLENRVVGLPLYYAGQVLLALSTHTPP
jgi:uncharacterized membrane protein YhhN